VGQGSSTPSPKEFDLVIFASGFNREHIPEVSGHKVTPDFWNPDDYTNPLVNYGGKDFAIVGMGDGALQDFLRLVCHTSFQCMSAILDKIKSSFVVGYVAAHTKVVVQPSRGFSPAGIAAKAPPTSVAEQIWLELERDLADIDRQHVLATPWDSRNNRGMADLHGDVLEVIKTFTARHAKILELAIDGVLRQSPIALNSIALIAPDPWPSKCYMLNRFLSALIMWRLQRPSVPLGLPRIESFQEKVNPSSITATVGGKYRIALKSKVRDFDRVVWRTGIGVATPTSWVDGLRVAIGKHPLPFYPPDRFR
jgi:hypothetical protein